MDFKVMQEEFEKCGLYNTQSKPDNEKQKYEENENVKCSTEHKSMDDMLASILRDLETAEVSLQSTTHLLDSTDSDSESNSKSQRKSEETALDPLVIDFKPIPHEVEDTDLEKSSPILEETHGNNNDKYGDKQELKQLLSSVELKEKSVELSENCEEETKIVTERSCDILDTEVSIGSDTKVQCFKDINPQDTLNQSESKPTLKIPLPSSNPYINFIQDFQSQYKGHEVTPSMLIAIATAKWRKMRKEEKQIYKNINKSHCEKNKQVEKVNKYIKTLKMSEEALFQGFHFEQNQL